MKCKLCIQIFVNKDLLNVNILRSVNGSFRKVDKLSSEVLQLDEVSFYYSQESPVFQNVCISADMEYHSFSACIYTPARYFCAVNRYLAGIG